MENPIIFHKDISDEVTEFVRLAYVEFSRERNDLYIHLKNNREEIKTLLHNLDNYCKLQNISEPFYEIIDLNI